MIESRLLDAMDENRRLRRKIEELQAEREYLIAELLRLEMRDASRRSDNGA